MSSRPYLSGMIVACLDSYNKKDHTSRPSVGTLVGISSPTLLSIAGNTGLSQFLPCHTILNNPKSPVREEIEEEYTGTIVSVAFYFLLALTETLCDNPSNSLTLSSVMAFVN
nr:hypothetical transcript [Hymenolepis microstoma]